MRRCSKCGLSMVDTATYCTVCGTRAAESSRQFSVLKASTPMAPQQARSVARLPRDDAATYARLGSGTRWHIIDEGSGVTSWASFDDPCPRDLRVTFCGKLVTPEASELSAAPRMTPVCKRCEKIARAVRAERAIREAEMAAAQEYAERRNHALEPLDQARALEGAQPDRAMSLYRESILRLLTLQDEPLANPEVRRNLLAAFDRLTIVLSKAGLRAEALEEADSATSLGLLGCDDAGTKGHREALRKRRESLRRFVAITGAAKQSPPG